MFMGPGDHYQVYPNEDTTKWPPPRRVTGNWHRGCVYDHPYWHAHTVHVSHTSDIKSNRMILLMDRQWADGGHYGVNYDWGHLAPGVSNHPSGKTVPSYSPNRMLGLAAGANVLLVDGSVHWMDLRGGNPNGLVFYHKDYYHLYYVTQEFKPDWTD
jgi:hypothetical protein